MYSMSPYSGPLLTDEESIRKYGEENHWGLHVAVDLGGCDHQKICDGDYIRQFAIDLADHIRMKRFGDPVVVRFGAEPKVEGYSLVQLIETSCIAGHFAEDTDRAFIDVFSCREFPPELQGVPSRVHGGVLQGVLRRRAHAVRDALQGHLIPLKQGP